MPQKPPQPLVPVYLLCEQVLQDKKTGKYVLIAPFVRMTLPGFPAAIQLRQFIRMTGGHGGYKFGLQVRDEEGQPVCEGAVTEPIQHPNPLADTQISWDLTLHFPAPGKYDLVLLAN